MDLQIQQYIDQQVQNKITEQFLKRDQQNASGLLFDASTGRATTGKNVFGIFGDKVFHNMLRLLPTQQTIKSGVINVTSSSMLVYTESSASSDDLDTINPGTLVYAGEELIMLRAGDDVDTVVVKNGTGNIICAGDCSLASVNDAIILRWDLLQQKWIELLRFSTTPTFAATLTTAAITANGLITANAGITLTASRLQQAKGSDIVAANTITLPTDGDCFDITGVTQIDNIATTGRQEGSWVTLQFDSNPLVTHDSAGSGARIFLNGNANFVTAANSTLSVRLMGGRWYEIGRKA